MSVLSPQVKQFAIITYKHGMLKLLNKVRPTYPTAFSPPGGPLHPHKKKKKELGNKSTFADGGGAKRPHKEKRN